MKLTMALAFFRPTRLFMVVLPHDLTTDSRPTCSCSIYTIPQRDTVAGEATFRS